MDAENQELRKVTLCFLRKEENILLAMKKRGFGVGKYNGVGGKVELGETIEDAARREIFEEIGVQAGELEKAAVIRFYFPLVPSDKHWNQEVHVYFVNNWEGEPRESEEMAPQWFNSQEVPFDKMWSDDKYWLPRVLKGEKVSAEFSFGEDESVTGYKIESGIK